MLTLEKRTPYECGPRYLGNNDAKSSLVTINTIYAQVRVLLLTLFRKKKKKEKKNKKKKKSSAEYSPAYE